MVNTRHHRYNNKVCSSGLTSHSTKIPTTHPSRLGSQTPHSTSPRPAGRSYPTLSRTHLSTPRGTIWSVICKPSPRHEWRNSSNLARSRERKIRSQRPSLKRNPMKGRNVIVENVPPKKPVRMMLRKPLPSRRVEKPGKRVT